MAPKKTPLTTFAFSTKSRATPMVACSLALQMIWGPAASLEILLVTHQKWQPLWGSKSKCHLPRVATQNFRHSPHMEYKNEDSEGVQTCQPRGYYTKSKFHAFTLSYTTEYHHWISICLWWPQDIKLPVITAFLPWNPDLHIPTVSEPPNRATAICPTPLFGGLDRTCTQHSS